MNELVKTFELQRSWRDLGPVHSHGEGTEKKWFPTICPCFGKGDSLSGRRHHSVHIGSPCGRVNQVVLENSDDGGESIGVEAPSVRGPPSLGLRARTKYVAQINGFVWGVPHTYESTAFGR